MSRWFRFYDAALDDPKVQRLPATTFKVWVNLLCVASRSGGALPPAADLAFMLRMSEQEVLAALGDLRQAGLVDDVDGDVTPHNWRERQFQSDSSTDRVKRFRNAKRNVSPAVTETPPDTETETERTKAYALDAEPASPPPAFADRSPDTPPVPAALSTPTDRLWTDGVQTLVSLGTPDAQARKMCGRWLRDTGNDAAGVLDAIAQARQRGTGDPIPFVTRVLSPAKDRQHDRRRDRSSSSAAADLLAEYHALGPRPADHGVGAPVLALAHLR